MRSLLFWLTFFLCGACSSSPTPATDSGTDTGTPAADSSLPALTCEGVTPIGNPDDPAGFDIDGDRAIMTGVIDGDTPALVMQLRADFPDLEVFTDM